MLLNFTILFRITLQEESRPKVSYNSEVLRAANCNRHNVESQKDEKKVSHDQTSLGENGDGDKGGNTNLLLALAAVLGIGGVVSYRILYISLF